MINKYVFVYLDNILIFSQSLQEHVQHIRSICKDSWRMSCLQMHLSTVSFLGFIISAGSVSIDPDKVKTVLEWQVPTSRKQLQRFLGFASFY